METDEGTIAKPLDSYDPLNYPYLFSPGDLLNRVCVIALALLSTACYWSGGGRGGRGGRSTNVVQLPPVSMDVRDTSIEYKTTAQDPFQPISRRDWPGPNRYRGANGSPGPDYWQQRADYGISAVLDTTARSIVGSVTIRYTNNSPDTLRYVWLQLDQNLYVPGSKGAALFPADSRWGVGGFKGGYTLHDVKVNGFPTSPHVHDTMMRLDLLAPILPKNSKGSNVAIITMGFDFSVPDHGSDRMGRDSLMYEIAQWYPRMAVYDDVRGWNTDPYLGQGEFYLEYGDIDYAVTVPAGYTVAGSGVLLNPNEVLTADQMSRLNAAAKDSNIVQIIAASEAVAKEVPGTKTWRFRAMNARDVAWAAAPDFRWDATSWKGILCNAYYQSPKAGKAWETGAEQTCWSIKTYSELFFPYPYPQATSVAGPVGGMEYPMFVMVHYGNSDSTSIFTTLDHEQGHEWFPMIIGSNERRYAWQDEGFNTYINAFSIERRYEGQQRALDVYSRYIGNWRDINRNGIDSPLMTAPDNINSAALGAVGYRKPGAVLLALRNHVVGKELFDDAFRSYIKEWAFKHPTPGDFFRTIENKTGEDLSWFWRSFFYTTDVLDIGIQSVRNDTADSSATIVLSRNTTVVFPVVMRIKHADGKTEDVRLPVNIWSQGNRFEASVSAQSPVVGVLLWPDPSVPDWNSTNDTWGDAPAKDPQRPVTY